MLKVVFSELAQLSIKEFVSFYKEAYFELYKDSGIWSEDLIVSQYAQSAMVQSANIIDVINDKLSNKKVLGRKSHKVKTYFEINFYCNDRYIIVYYKEDLKRGMRFVEFIGINNKPIIF